MKINSTRAVRWQLKTLGVPRLELGGEQVKLSRRKSLGILVYLLVRNRPCARETLASWFWPDLYEREAKTALRTSLSDLNRAFGTGWLEQSGENLIVAHDLPLDVDLLLLCNAAKNKMVTPLAELEKWQDDFLEGFSLDGCDVFEEWCYSQRQAAKNVLFQVMGNQLTLLLTNKDWSSASALATRWLILDPLSEHAHMALMDIYFNVGKASQAVIQYRKLETKLKEELGVAPSQAAKELINKIEMGLSPHVSNTEGVIERKQLCVSDIAYARNGLVNIAYKKFGKAEMHLVVVSGFISHLEQLFEEPQLRCFLEELAQRFTVVVFDKRGMGLSDRTGYPPSLDETSNDVVAILNHTDIQQAWVLGISEGGPAAIRCAHDHPHRVKGIMLFGTTAKWTASNDYPYSVQPELYEKWLNLLEKNWGTAINLEHFAPSCSDDAFMVQWWKKTLRMASSPGAIKAVLSHAKDMDVRCYLKHITQPTLVVHQCGDRIVHAENGRYLAAHIPNSDYFELPGNDHWLWVCDTKLFFRKLDEFIHYEAIS